MVDTNKELEKSFWFYIIDDYRTSRKIYTYTHPPKNEDEEEQSEEEDNAPEEACEIKFLLPKEGKRIYIVNEFPKYKTIWYKDINDENDAEILYLKIFSQIHNCMPFKITGYNFAYKEEGYYPDIPDEIKFLPNVISKKLVKKIIHCEDSGYYFLFIVDSNGIDYGSYLLCPI